MQQHYQRPLLKLKLLSKDKLKALNNTAANLKALSPQKVNLSLERSRSSDKLQYALIKRMISEKTIPVHQRNSEKIQHHLNEQFLRECKHNNTQNSLQLLEPTIAHQIFNIPPPIHYKADINCQDYDGNNALHLSAINGNIALVQSLIFKQIQIDVENSEKMTPFLISCFHGHEEIFEILLKANANPNHQDSNGNTALHYGSKFGHKLILETLLKIPNIQFLLNHEQKYPDHYAENSEITHLFIKFQNIKKKNKQIPIHNITNDFFFKIRQINKMHTSPVNLSHEAKLAVVKQKRVENQNKKLLVNTASTTIDSMKQSKEDIGPQQFQVIGLIGKGSFGEVYLVQKQQKLYAMKVLHKKQNICRYAQTERNVLSITSHPFIVKLRYAFQTQDKLFMILDYCPGGDLGQVLNRVKKIPEELVKLYMCEVILALEDLHKRDIIFRDLKPDNIVLDAQGHAMLTDFGLSKEGIFESNKGASSFCGSIAYLAPEMLRREGHGKSVDWYLLGVVMFELLVGLPPYYSNDRNELFFNIENASLKIPQFISVECRILLKSLLERSPAKRLGSGNGDYQEIKDHPYFKDIDWIKVFNRKLELPKPNKIVKTYNVEKNVFDMQSFIDADKAHVDGWSFVQ